MEDHGLTDERLAELYQRALAGRGAAGREKCVAPEDLRALARREGSEARRLEVLDHAMACTACRAELDLLRSLVEAGAEAERRATRRRWAWLPAVAVAAAATIALGIGVKVLAPPARVERGAGDAVSLLAPPADLGAAAPQVFSWQPVPGAVRYDLEVLDETGAVVLARQTEATSLTLPDASRLAPGTGYRWWVRATLASGEVRASPARSLRIRTR